MKISTHVGSIVDPELGCDAIVNASNPDVALGSGVSAAIREACGGAAYQRELREALDAEFGEPLSAEDCLTTSAGTASAFRWVLHVPAVDYRARDPETGGATGPCRVRACVRAALDAAARLGEEHGLRRSMRVAFPLLGAGAGGLGVVVSADVMASAIREWLDSAAPRALDEVCFVVLDDASALLVERALANHGLSPAGRSSR